MISVYLDCDKCENQLSIGAENFVAALNDARKEGWASFSSGPVGTYCPSCKPVSKEEDKAE